MKKVIYTGICLLFIYESAQSQDNNDKKFELTLISQVNQGNSYITFPTDIGNIEPSWIFQKE